MTLPTMLYRIFVCVLMVLVWCQSSAAPGLSDKTPQDNQQSKKERPNFLFIISDDQSWAHTSKAGYKYVKTPNFDRIANEGVYFSHAYAAAPSCTASRSALLTGQHIWNTESGALLWSTWPNGMMTFQDRLEAADYTVGYTGKAWGPGVIDHKTRSTNPAGKIFNQRKRHPVIEERTAWDLALNLDIFLAARPASKPFSFWVGSFEPHQPFQIPAEPRFSDKEGEEAVPGFLPNKRHVQRWVSAYLNEVEWLDEDIGKLLAVLEKHKQLDNTIVIVTSDNGMDFPHAKSTNYEYGVRVPLAMRWGKHIDQPGRTEDAMVSLVDIMPTLLDAAAIAPAPNMAGSSLMPILLSAKHKEAAKRTAVFTAFERHSPHRQGTLTYPRRAIHTAQYALIRNYFPSRWPAGDEPYFGDISQLQLLVSKVSGKPIEPYFTLATAKVPAEELYDLAADPFEMHNVIDDPKYQAVKKQLSAQLDAELVKSHDPVHNTRQDYFAQFPYLGSDKFENFWIRSAEKK